MSLQRMAAAKLWLTAEGSATTGGATYLATALYAMPTVVTDQVATIAADERWRIYVNPDWLDTTDIPVLASHLAHLVWHLLRDHAGRARSMAVGTRESSAWATATDLTISQTLDAAGTPLHELPRPEQSGYRTNLAAEEYFTLIDRMGAAASSSDDSALCECGSAADGLTRAYQVSNDDTAGIDDIRADQIRQQVAISFSDHMRQRGDTPGEWFRWVQQVLEPKVPWQQVLQASVRRAVAWTHGSTHPTYRKLSRRQAASPHTILPGSHKPLPAVGVVVDSSASMDDGLLAQALGEVDGVLRSLGSAVGTVNIYSCDAAAHAAGKVRRAHDLKIIGGGGTDLRVGFDFALAAKPRPEILIILTDGDTPWPAAAPAACVVVAVLITRGGAPRCPGWVQRVECDAA